MSEVTGVTDAGFKTTQLPAASAGAIFHDAMISGKFHGVMPAQTPIGSRTTRFLLGTGTVSSYSSRIIAWYSSPQMNWPKCMKVWAAPGTSMLMALRIVPPPSCTSAAATSSWRSKIAMATRWRISPRSCGDLLRHTPLSCARLGGRDGLPHVLAIGDRDRRPRLLGRGIDGGRGLAALGGLPLAVDEQSELFHGILLGAGRRVAPRVRGSRASGS